MLEAIAKAENIEVTEEELNKEIENMASSYRMEVDKVKEMLNEEYTEGMKLDIAVQKAVDFVVEASVEV